jgi:hypothetical protein
MARATEATAVPVRREVAVVILETGFPEYRPGGELSSRAVSMSVRCLHCRGCRIALFAKIRYQKTRLSAVLDKR